MLNFVESKFAMLSMSKKEAMEKHFPNGKIFSSYSFINVAYGHEESGDNSSFINFVPSRINLEIIAVKDDCSNFSVQCTNCRWVYLIVVRFEKN